MESIRQELPEAERSLLDLVLKLSRPYFNCNDHQEELASICDTVWNAIQEDALIRPEFLPAFIETLAWQELKNSKVPEPLVPSRPRLTLAARNSQCFDS